MLRVSRRGRTHRAHAGGPEHGNSTGRTGHHPTRTLNCRPHASACLLAPPPATQNEDRRGAPGHSSQPCGPGVASAGWRPTGKVPHAKRTHAGMHAHTASLAGCALGQGLILTESLPLYILYQNPEYTKGNLALSTKQEQWAGPPLPIPGLASTRAVGPREGTGDAGSAGQGAHTSCQVCAQGPAPHPSEFGQGQMPPPLPKIGITSRHRSTSRNGAQAHGLGDHDLSFCRTKLGTSARKFCRQCMGTEGIGTG